MSIIAREPIEVLAMFKAGQIKPRQFRWGMRTYDVRRIDLAFSERKGRDKLSYFSIYDGTNTFRLAYSTEAQQWYIETEDTLL
jgi:hypothetical protein